MHKPLTAWLIVQGTVALISTICLPAYGTKTQGRAHKHEMLFTVLVIWPATAMVVAYQPQCPALGAAHRTVPLFGHGDFLVHATG